MKRRTYLALFAYVALILLLMMSHLFSFFDFKWELLMDSPSRLMEFLVFGLFSTLLLTLMLLLILKLNRQWQKRQLEKALDSLLKGQAIPSLSSKKLDQNLAELDQNLRKLRLALQKSQNQVLEDRERIVEQERKRIARDLHDTVSQELFAASMTLSGLVYAHGNLPPDKMESQLKSTADLIETAQKDLRILLLHLRPQELEGRSLEEGIERLMAELRDKSSLMVHLDLDLAGLPATIEEQVFRIVQEAISNSLRHAQANHFGLTMKQGPDQLLIRINDDGVGFDPAEIDGLSYGLKNMEERVHSMAGTFEIHTAPLKGTILSIAIPLLEKENV